MIYYEDNQVDNLFEQAIQQVQQLHNIADQQKLKLYGLYKQSLFGNNKTDKPGFTDFKGKAKWNAWKHESGKGSSKAKNEYIQYVNELLKSNTN